jgi:hypothetical protein
MKPASLPLRSVLLPALVVFAAACGGEDHLGDPDGDEHPQPGGCTISLAGELTGTYPCVASAGHNAGEERSVVGVIATDLGKSLKTLTIAAELPGAATEAEYAGSELRTAGLVLQTADDRLFVATRSEGGDDRGALGPLRLTALDLVATQGGTKAWRIRGSFSASLVELTSGKTVTLTATF